MTQNLLDISEKIDSGLVELLEVVKYATDRLGIPLFVVGATARDMVLRFYDETPARATRDVDIGIRVASWEQFNTLRDALMGTGKFEPGEVQHRLLSQHGMPLDIVPFGGLADESAQIRWPNEEDRVMRVLGFDEAYNSALIVRIRRYPALEVRVASLPGVVITKLISWSDKYPERTRDALDIHLIMTKYIDAGGLERLSSEAKDLIETESEIDIELAGVRLIGRDMARIATPPTLKVLREILARETSAGQESRLVRDMVGQLSFGEEQVFTRAAALLREVETGLGEGMGKEE